MPARSGSSKFIDSAFGGAGVDAAEQAAASPAGSRASDADRSASDAEKSAQLERFIRAQQELPRMPHAEEGRTLIDQNMCVQSPPAP